MLFDYKCGDPNQEEGTMLEQKHRKSLLNEQKED